MSTISEVEAALVAASTAADHMTPATVADKRAVQAGIGMAINALPKLMGDDPDDSDGPANDGPVFDAPEPEPRRRRKKGEED